MKMLPAVSVLTFTKADEDLAVVYGTDDTKKECQEVSNQLGVHHLLQQLVKPQEREKCINLLAG